jgi:predicted dehydrogenase
MRLGLIGVGRWGKRYIETISRMEGIALGHIASTNPRSAELIPGSCKLSTDWRAVISDGDIDGIILATPPATHIDMTLMSIETGLPTLVEKPMTLTARDAGRLVRAATEGNVLVMVDHTHLFGSAFRTLQERGNSLGSLLGVRSVGGNHGPFRPDTPVLWDWGPHDISMCLELFGETSLMVEACRSARRTTAEGVGETIDIVLQFSNNRRAEIRVSNIESCKQRWFEARYTGGTLVYDDLAANKLAFRTRDEQEATAITVDGTPPLTTVVNEFCQCIGSGRRVDPSLMLGQQVVNILATCQTRLDKGCISHRA